MRLLPFVTVFLAPLARCIPVPVPESESDSAPILVRTPELEARQSKTNVSGTVVNFTETPPFQITLPPEPQPTEVHTVTAAVAAAAAPTSLRIGPPTPVKSLQQEVADGGGRISFPTSSDVWTLMEDCTASWTLLNYTLDVWLSNSDPNVLSEDALVATVPPGTFSLLTLVPEGVKAGKNYTIYLTPNGNQSYIISRSEPFVIRTLTMALFNAAPRRAASLPLGSVLAAAVAGLGLAAVV